MTSTIIGSGIPTAQQQGYYEAGDGGAAIYDWSPTSTATADGVTVLLPAGQSAATPGRMMLRVNNVVRPEVGGAYCDNPIGATTGHDDTTALNNLSSYLQNGAYSGGIIQQGLGKTTGCKITGPVTARRGVWFRGSGMPLTANGGIANTMIPFIMPTASGSLVCGASSKITDMVVMKAGLASKPLTMEDASAYISTTIQDGSIGVDNNGSDCQIKNVMSIGFQTGFRSIGGARLVVDTFYGDNGTVVDISAVHDTAFVHEVRGFGFWTFSTNNRIGAYGPATVFVAGSGYVDGDLVSPVGGTLTASTSRGGAASQAAVYRASVTSGGATALIPVDSGDYTVAPTTYGAASASLASGGTGGANGAVVLTVTNSTCPTPPTFSGTISGGVLQAGLAVATPGVCGVNTLPPVATLSGGGLIGASANTTVTKNPLAFTGGSGTGLTATINTQDSGYRPGVGAYIHDNAEGFEGNGLEFEEYQTQVLLSNIWNTSFNYIGGEGGYNNNDHQMVGVKTQNCVADTMIYKPNSDANWIGLDLQHATAANGGNCTGATNGGANVAVITGHLGFNTGYSLAAIRMGPGSTGTITNPILGWATGGWPAAVQMQSGAGLWRLNDFQFDAYPPTKLSEWISVAPTATPPQSPQFANAMQGSLIENGDFLIDQPNEGASNNASLLRVDRWRMANQIGANIATQRVLTGPLYTIQASLRLTNGASATIPAANTSGLFQQVEGPNLSALAWGTTSAIPAEAEWCAQASVTGTYNVSWHSGGYGASYVHPFNITAANVWQCFATVVPAPPIGAWGVNQGAVGLIERFDTGSGTNLIATPDTWTSGAFYTTAGAVEFAANASATYSLAGVHLRPGPFAANYVPRDFAFELAKAQRYYAKSEPVGTAAGQNKGSVGSTSFYNGATTGSWGEMAKFPVPMALTPTVTLASTNAATANCYDKTKAADVGAASAVNTGTNGFLLSCSLASGTPAVGDQIEAAWAADTGF